jgi:hypothetical protein
MVARADQPGKAKRVKARISQKRVRSFVNELFGPSEHARRVESLANAVGITQLAVPFLALPPAGRPRHAPLLRPSEARSTSLQRLPAHTGSFWRGLPRRWATGREPR